MSGQLKKTNLVVLQGMILLLIVLLFTLPPLAAKGDPKDDKKLLKGKITSLVDKEGGLVLTNLGKEEGVKKGDKFVVYKRYKTKAVTVEEKKGRLIVTELVGEDRSLCKVENALVSMEVGDTVVESTSGSVKSEPKARFEVETEKPTALEGVHFKNLSSVERGEIKKFLWEFGDGTKSKAKNPSHRYRDDGTYTVKLTVFAKDGTSDSTSKRIEISNRPPKASFFFHPDKITTTKEITFDACETSEEEGRITNFGWDWDGDNRYEAHTKKCQIQHKFESKGPRQVKLKVTDDEGASDTLTKKIEIRNLPPKASFSVSAPPFHPGKEIKLDASSTKDPDSEKINYKWVFGEGPPLWGTSVEKTFDDPGKKVIKLEVTDEEGARSTVTKKIKIKPKVFYNESFINLDGDKTWESNNLSKIGEAEGEIKEENNRKLSVKTEGSKANRKFYHRIKPVKKGFIEQISETKADLSSKTFTLKGKGYLQKGKITFDLLDGIVEKKVTDWNGNPIRSTTKMISLAGGESRKNPSFYITFLTGEASEIIVLDLVLGPEGRPLVFCTTELFNHEKLFSSKTSLQSGVKPKEVNIPPHLIVNLPNSSPTVGRKTSFDFINYDPDGEVSKLKVDWGDGTKDVVKGPRKVKLELNHRYKKEGQFTVEAIARDKSGQENNTTRAEFEIEVVKGEQETESSSGSGSGGGGGTQITGGYASYDLALK